MMTQSDMFDFVAQQVSARTPVATIELIARQLERAENASQRIEREGEVVRDIKGAVVPHPAILIEQNATKMATDLLSKHKK